MPSAPPRKLSSGPSRHLYDAIVFGGQLGGALCASLLAKRSHRVLFVEHDGLGAQGYEHGGFVLPYAPFVLPPLDSMPAVKEAFTELGLTTTFTRAVRPHAPGLQLILPRHRIDLPNGAEGRVAELRRELGQTGEQVAVELSAATSAHEGSDAFFKSAEHLSPQGMLEGWSLERRAKKIPALGRPSPLSGGDPATHLLSALVPFLAHVDAPEGVAKSRPLSCVLKGPAQFPRGPQGLRALLLERLSALGGDVLLEGGGARVERLTFEGSELVGLELLSSENLYRASSLVAATEAAALRRLLPEKRRQRALAEQLDLSTVRRFLLAVNWILPTAALPRGMGDLLVLDAPSDLGPVLVQVSPAKKTSSKSDEETASTVCAAALVPASARELGEAHLREIAAGIETALDGLLPFAREARVLASIPLLDASGDRGSRLLPHPLYALEAGRHLGITGLSTRTPVKNLYLANREVLPGLGLEGELMAGIQAAALVQEAQGKRNLLGR